MLTRNMSRLSNKLPRPVWCKTSSYRPAPVCTLQLTPHPLPYFEGPKDTSRIITAIIKSNYLDLKVKTDLGLLPS